MAIMENPQRVLVFDVETTGTDKRSDQVIELCVQHGVDPGSKSQVWRLKPSIAISPGAQAVHGISMEDVADCPRFVDLADEIRAIFEAADVWVGYNVAFDIEMLQAEFRRNRMPELSQQDKVVVDAFRLWQRCEPRSLQDAHRRFVGGEFEAAHSASADVAATGNVLVGMVRDFGLSSNWQEVADICEPARKTWVGPSHHIQWNREGQAVIAFGKHTGAVVIELAKGADSGYLRWIMQKDFPAHVRDICAKALEDTAEQFAEWLKTTFAGGSSSDSVAAETLAVAS